MRSSRQPIRLTKILQMQNARLQWFLLQWVRIDKTRSEQNESALGGIATNPRRSVSVCAHGYERDRLSAHICRLGAGVRLRLSSRQGSPSSSHHMSSPTRRAFTNVWRSKTSTAHCVASKYRRDEAAEGMHSLPRTPGPWCRSSVLQALLQCQMSGCLPRRSL